MQSEQYVQLNSAEMSFRMIQIRVTIRIIRPTCLEKDSRISQNLAASGNVSSLLIMAMRPQEYFWDCLVCRHWPQCTKYKQMFALQLTNCNHSKLISRQTLFQELLNEMVTTFINDGYTHPTALPHPHSFNRVETGALSGTAVCDRTVVKAATNRNTPD